MKTTDRKSRIDRLAEWLTEHKINAAVFQDSEDSRDSNITYLTGHPNEALLFVFDSGKTVLVPWDVAMAEKTAEVDEIVPYNSYRKQIHLALPGVLDLNGFGSGKGKVMELSEKTTHLNFKAIQSAMPSLGLLCREDGVGNFISEMRKIKSEEEIEIYDKACALTDQIIEGIERQLKDGKIKTEIDIAMYIERISRELGGEGPSFEIIAAGPQRSFGIHAVPSYTAESLTEKGLSIIDFGMKYRGYCTDVTIGIARGPLTEKQKVMTELILKIYDKSLAIMKPGNPVKEIAVNAENILNSAGYSLDHALGHGIGLDVHETPILRTRDASFLQPGMVIALEPGVYDAKAGGIRMENDILITDEGHKVLTNSRIIYL